MSSAVLTAPSSSSSISVAISTSHSTSIFTSTFCVVRPQFFSSGPLRCRPLSLSPISHPSPLHPRPLLAPYPSPHYPSNPTPPLLRATSSNLNSAVSSPPSPPGEEEEYYEEHDCGGPEDGNVDEGTSPWEGAVVYRRNPMASHVEYCTTLERLGLGKVSSKLSVSRASSMGLRLTPRAARECGGEGVVGTPVLISLDVTSRSRKKRSIRRLDGIIRTVISLDCNRCGEPAAENVFSNFSLLLTDTPIEEQEEVADMGVIYGDDKSNASAGEETRAEDDDIELDDRLYFPAGEKEIDISKHIRDLVHVEITIEAICDLNCKGICLECGVNLNTKSCKCSKDGRTKNVGLGPLGNLRNQMRQKKG